MTEEGFRRYLHRYIDKRIPFLAYWHPQGYGLIRLDEVMVPRKPPCETPGFKDSEGPKKPHTLTKAGRRKWEKNMGQLRRQCCGQVITVEYDGENIKTEGGFEL